MLPPFSSKALVVGAQVAQAFIQTHHLAYAQVSPDLRIKLVSPNFITLLPDPSLLLQDALLPELLWEFVGTEDALHALLSGAEPAYNIESVNRQLPDGSTMYLNFQVLPIDDANPGSGLLLIVEDVTHTGQLEQSVVQDRNELRLAQAELKRANQELEHLNRFKSFMLSMAAHDMRGPLEVILLYADLLRGSLGLTCTPPQGHMLDIILSQVDGLNRLIKNLLSLDQAEQGRLSIDLAPCQLDKLVQRVLADLRVVASANKLHLNVSLPSEPVLLMADADCLKQVISNLVGNAFKYTPEGGTVSISLRQEQDQAMLEISDTGRGMTAEQVENLFQPYYRAENAKKSSITGYGLGLFIARTLIEAHHGAIAVSSQPGQGTIFSLRLPLSPLPGKKQSPM